MANSTPKSSKAKTKTTKKPAAAKASAKPAVKTIKKPVSTTTKRPSVKAAAGKPSTTTQSAPVVVDKKITKEAKARRAPRILSAGGLRRWHLISAIVFALLAVLAAVFMDTTAYKLLRGHLTSDALTSQTQTVFAPAQHVIANLELRWLVVVTLSVSALFAAWRWYNARAERQALDNRIAPLRWIDASVTGALIVATIGFISGMQEIVTLALLGTLVVASAVYAWIAERENANANRVVRGAFISSFLSGALVLLALNAYAVATVVYGLIRSPWYTYALYALAVVAGLAVALNQIRQYRRIGNWSNYLYVERNYIAINLLTKVAFAVILIVGLLK